MDYRRILIFIAILSFYFQLASIDINIFYEQIRAKFDSVRTLQADVAQTNEYAQSKTKLVSSGKLFYKPGHFLLEYAKPNIQKLIIKGNSVIIYDKNSKTIIKTVNSEGISNPLQMVDKYWSISRKELVTDDSASVRVRLFPPKEDKLKRIEVNFDRTSLLINELFYWDNSGNKVKYRFLNIRTGILIPSSKWNFVPPKGIKVIEQ
jgi:outer membrane lipoprotein-sorting protein